MMFRISGMLSDEHSLQNPIEIMLTWQPLEKGISRQGCRMTECQQKSEQKTVDVASVHR